MLKGQLIHPPLLSALGRAGHGSKILIADSNYPAATTAGPNAEKIFLNVSPGVVDAVTLLKAIASTIEIEAAHVMAYATEGPYALEREPAIWQNFRETLGGQIELEPLERFKFYETVGQPDVAAVIASGETAIYANLLLTIGVVRSD